LTSAQAWQAQQNQPSQTAKPSRPAFDFRLDSLSSAASLVKLLPLVQGAGAGRSAPLVQVEKPYVVGFQWQNTNQSEVAQLKREVDQLKAELTRLQDRMESLTGTRIPDPLLPGISGNNPIVSSPQNYGANPQVVAPVRADQPGHGNSPVSQTILPYPAVPTPVQPTFSPILAVPNTLPPTPSTPAKLQSLLGAIEGLPESTQLSILKTFLAAEGIRESTQNNPAIFQSRFRPIQTEKETPQSIAPVPSGSTPNR
jgi:hypothetical protein